ncbi:MAG: DUF1579 family protein [Armatimonadota bacterium]
MEGYPVETGVRNPVELPRDVEQIADAPGHVADSPSRRYAWMTRSNHRILLWAHPYGVIHLTLAVRVMIVFSSISHGNKWEQVNQFDSYCGAPYAHHEYLISIPEKIRGTGSLCLTGTFIGAMMTNLWLYDGALDAAERVLTLDTEGSSMAAEGKMARYQDAIDIISDDHRVLTSRMLGDDGQWRLFMTARYRRKT